MRTIAVAVLLMLGVGVELLACLGVMVMTSAYDRLHFTAPATTIGPLAIAAAVIIEESLSTAGVKAILIAGLLLVVNPVLTHATARAGGIRTHGDFMTLEDKEARP
ncbi:MAG: monovalent cation/H(+) antiporter subunit G [Actinobacteria bacterium]|nr:monovalent cation/H(+) antiporter subunit G [Actinomycetota bacterium]